MDKLRDEVIDTIRACLISAKGGVCIQNLNNDYNMLSGENIPYKSLGYQSLESFLKSETNIRLVSRCGQIFVEAKPTEESAHITRLISKQKKSTKSKKKASQYRRTTQVRQPRPKQNYSYSQNKYKTSNSHYSSSAQQRAEYNSKIANLPSLMNLRIIPPITVAVEPPRFIHSNVSEQNSPSKRLKNRLENVPNKSTYQSLNTVIIEKPKTVQNDAIKTDGKMRDINERLRRLVTIPSAVPTPQILTFEESPPSNCHTSALNDLDSPTANYAPDDVRYKLENCVKRLGLAMPVYKMNVTKTKMYLAQVKIDNSAYLSFPDEKRTEEEAQRIAAAKALADLESRHATALSLPETKNENVINIRILEIVNEHPFGVFLSKLPAIYREQYKENLPLHWAKIVRENPLFSVEKGAVNSMILMKSKGLKTAESMQNSSDGPLSPSTDKIQLNPLGQMTMPKLELPKELCWMLYVTTVINTSEVWGRIINDEYSENFDILTEQMTLYYNKNKDQMKIKLIEVNKYYAVLEDDVWNRVQCTQYESDSKTVVVTFIDQGYEEEYPVDRLHSLANRFYYLPAQSLKITLNGLEGLEDCYDIVPSIEKALLESAHYVQVVSHGTDQEGPWANVIFYDTSGEEDINLNNVFINNFLTRIVETPKLNKDVITTNVFISHVEENGDIFIQIQTKSMSYLTNMLNHLTRTEMNTEDKKRCAVTAIDTTETYFVQFEGNWYRGKVVNICANSQVRMYLIDFGRIITVGRTNLLDLKQLSVILANFPAQALKVRLYNIDPSLFNVDKLMELAPTGMPLLVKLMNPSASGVPIVELFTRVETSNLLVSINNSLMYQSLEKDASGDGNNNVKPRKRIPTKTICTNEDLQATSLKPPKIPNVGEYFDVYVTMAANPSNFIVRPFDDKGRLQAMMIELQNSCRKPDVEHPTSDKVTEGKLFAGEHTDGQYYRVYVLNVISKHLITAYFVDFGDVSVLTLDKLQPLGKEFLNLPYQAIKARLVGIQPTNIDWSVADCIRFQEMVVEKDFVSQIIEQEDDEFSPNRKVLGLILIDTSTQVDIYIHQLLMDEGRAIKTGV